jgi:hypothetical protein
VTVIAQLDMCPNLDRGSNRSEIEPLMVDAADTGVGGQSAAPGQ